LGLNLENRSKVVAQPIESLAQGPPPLLVPVRSPTRIATTIAFPPSNTVHATPGSVFVNSDLVRRRMRGEVLAIIRKASKFVLFDVMESIRKRHITVRVVMPIRFSVGGDV